MELQDHAVGATASHVTIPNEYLGEGVKKEVYYRMFPSSKSDKIDNRKTKNISSFDEMNKGHSSSDKNWFLNFVTRKQPVYRAKVVEVAGVVHLLVELHMEGHAPELLVAPEKRSIEQIKKKTGSYQIVNIWIKILKSDFSAVLLFRICSHENVDLVCTSL